MVPQLPKQPLKKAGAVLMAALLVISPLPLRAGDLNAEITSSAAIRTAPAFFKGCFGKRGTMTCSY